MQGTPLLGTTILPLLRNAKFRGSMTSISTRPGSGNVARLLVSTSMKSHGEGSSRAAQARRITASTCQKQHRLPTPNSLDTELCFITANANCIEPRDVLAPSTLLESAHLTTCRSRFYNLLHIPQRGVGSTAIPGGGQRKGPAGPSWHPSACGCDARNQPRIRAELLEITLNRTQPW
ncbi:hypothetical protein N658DRAFT_172848 [Parathielavia hyrcaniae]|uniref:Uncharacterized protein n=1 Tax=Parathielavia hyrcaniae TaxID=113614 RepID=A0AAN6PWT6_9PEZI|nr:hypothetical protein N658DRAFT_172848 [Parathielavia hyrcaniae]